MRSLIRSAVVALCPTGLPSNDRDLGKRARANLVVRSAERRRSPSQVGLEPLNGRIDIHGLVCDCQSEVMPRSIEAILNSPHLYESGLEFLAGTSVYQNVSSWEVEMLRLHLT